MLSLFKNLSSTKNRVDRRHFLKIGTMAALTSFMAIPAFANNEKLFTSPRSLALYNTHTGETVETVYYKDGRCQIKALEKIDHLFRDHRTGEVMHIDTGLLDLLHAISKKVAPRAPLHIISGYRSPATNAMLCKCNKGVAVKSLHIQGKAVDIRIP